MKKLPLKSSKKEGIKKTFAKKSQYLLSSCDCKPLPATLQTEAQLKLVMYWCRGFQRRNLIKLILQMRKSGFSSDFIQNIKLSFCKFKLMASLYPSKKQFFVWVFKTFLTAKGQESVQKVYEFFSEDPYDYPELTLCQYEEEFRGTRRFAECMRLMDMKDWIPLNLFPLVDIDKPGKMSYAFLPYNLDKKDEVKDKIRSYLYNLGVKELFVPPSDSLLKVGNQKYNDGGRVEYDKNRPTYTMNSSFKYQRFITQPLTPREVWLPGKALKLNNAFWMVLGRQFLRADPVYPSTDPSVLCEQISSHRNIIKFDISGFGFQYLREYILYCGQAIAELYPSSEIDEALSIMQAFFEKVSVEMPNGEFVYPPRGIGLGYYEDLKTIVMIALLQDYKPISVYGDQGLLEIDGIGAIQYLQECQFEIKFEKVEFLASGEIPSVVWAGRRFMSKNIYKPMEFLNPLFGAFFSRYHWERKNSLLSVAEEFPIEYHKKNKILCDMYKVIHGWEFFPTELYQNFNNCGISLKSPTLNGQTKHWRVEDLKSPMTSIMFDTTFVSPFIPQKPRSVPWKEAKSFSVKRKRLFKNDPIMDNSLYRYSNPRLEYNKRPLKLNEKMLPSWADFLLIANHSMTTGGSTSGLRGEQLTKAVVRQVFATDPFRARATGGYKILTPHRCVRGPSSESWLVAENLSKMSYKDLTFVRRADLKQNPSMMNDSIYYNADLITNPYDRVEGSKTIEVLDEEQENLSFLIEKLKSISDAPTTVEALFQAVSNTDLGQIPQQALFVEATESFSDEEDVYGLEPEDLDLEDCA